jgi:hypothetical protein
MMQAVGQPDVDIQGRRTVLDLLDGGVPQRHGMAAELIEEVTVE